MAYAWVRGEFVEDSSASVSIFDHGLVVGDGAFETIAVLEGRPFALTRHLRRLERTAEGMGLPAPKTEEVAGAITELVHRNGMPFAKIRVTYTAGNAGLGSGRSGEEPVAVVAMQPIEMEPASTQVALAPWPRNERGVLAGLKTTSYAENVVALAWASSRGASEVIFANTVGNLCEGSGSNIFVVKGEQILTPPLSAGPLAGVTRDLVVEGMGVAEVDIPVADLFKSEVTEIFITSTIRMVQGVSRFDDRQFSPAPGAVTVAAQEYFSRLIGRDMDP